MKKINHILLFLLVMLGCRPNGNAQTPGLLVGMTYGGSNGGGTVFSYDPISTSYNVLVSFNVTNGWEPVGDVIQAKNGLLYGMASYGGNGLGSGVIFSYDLSTGNQTVLVNFVDTMGLYPYGSLLQASDGMLYGMTNQGGKYNNYYSNGNGVMFRYNPLTNQDTVLINFNDTDGAAPFASLIQAKDGKLYGMTTADTGNHGVLFSYNLVTHKDSVLVRFNNTNGSDPQGSLVQDTNGLIYGFTNLGGYNGGVLFSYNPLTGKDSVIRKLSDTTGYNPYDGSLVHDTNGILYGMARYSLSYGDLFKYNPANNTFTVLQNFSNLGDSGATPFGSPLLASNGLIYGMTSAGGLNTAGEIFSYNLITMKETPLFSFESTGTSGNTPYGDLTEVMYVSFTARDSLKCAGDSNGWIKLSARGAKLPVTYLWSNGSTTDSIGGLKAGPDTCIVTDATGKTFRFILNIYQPQKLIANATVKNACGGNNGLAWAGAVGGTMPYTFTWSNSATTDTISSLVPGSYTCVVTDTNGCMSSGTVQVDTAKTLKIDSVKATRSSCNGCSDGTATVYVSGGTPAGDSACYFYVWTYGGDSAAVKGIPGGEDSICVTSCYGCGSVCASAFVVTGIPTITDLANRVNIFPVPSNGKIFITTQGSGFEGISITDELGIEVYSDKLNAAIPNYVLHPDLSNLPNGIYLVQFLTDKGNITRKLVIQK